MASKIRILDELTINKIAAGEVIENPASVVKELVENSLDAGSTDIHIEISCGGRQHIRIVDNGCGMTRDDALLCLERYATSKIREVDDLSSLITMGFRGEALPSIASISKLTLLTRPSDGADATLIIADGGRILQCCDAAREPGTTLEVKALFFNVPVRRKFQRSPAYDTTSVQKCVSLLALAHPQVRFTLISDQKTLLVAPAASATDELDQLIQRTSVILGREFVDEAAPVQLSTDEYQIKGLIALPSTHRPNRSGQYLFINERAVVSPLVSHAVRDGYGTALPSQRYPAFVLHLKLPGDQLDVNVHPQKREVRLRQEHQLREMLQKAVSSALQGEPSISYATPWPTASSPWNESASPAQSLEADTPLPPLPWDTAPARRPPPQAWSQPFLPMLRECAEEPVARPALFMPSRPSPKVLSCLTGFILLDPSTCEGVGKGEVGLWIVDQRAAHSRILHDRLTKSTSQQVIETQPLLIPLTLQLSSIDHAILFEAIPELQRIGFAIDSFGPQSLRVQAVPLEFKDLSIGDCLLEIAEELRGLQGQTLLERERAKRLALRASRSALTRKVQLNRAEAGRLIDDLFRSETPYFCPLGKPTLVCLNAEAINKLFQR